jgi:hypothetical protein
MRLLLKQIFCMHIWKPWNVGETHDVCVKCDKRKERK